MERTGPDPPGAGDAQTASIIACTVIMLSLSAIAFALRVYTRLVILRVASYEDLLVGFALVS